MRFEIYPQYLPAQKRKHMMMMNMYIMASRQFTYSHMMGTHLVSQTGILRFEGFHLPQRHLVSYQ